MFFPSQPAKPYFFNISVSETSAPITKYLSLLSIPSINQIHTIFSVRSFLLLFQSKTYPLSKTSLTQPKHPIFSKFLQDWKVLRGFTHSSCFCTTSFASTILLEIHTCILFPARSFALEGKSQPFHHVTPKFSCHIWPNSGDKRETHLWSTHSFCSG